MSFKERHHKQTGLIEEAKSPKYSPAEIQKAAGRDFVYTSDPKENILDLMHPIKTDAVSADDLEQRAKVLQIDKETLERNMAIRDPEGSGYTVDNAKLAGYASRKYPELTYSNTVGSPKHLAVGAALPAVLGGLYGAYKGATGSFDSPLEGAAIIGSLGAGIGGAANALGNYVTFRQGQVLHDRLNQKKTSK